MTPAEAWADSFIREMGWSGDDPLIPRVRRLFVEKARAYAAQETAVLHQRVEALENVATLLIKRNIAFIFDASGNPLEGLVGVVEEDHNRLRDVLRGEWRGDEREQRTRGSKTHSHSS